MILKTKMSIVPIVRNVTVLSAVATIIYNNTHKQINTNSNRSGSYFSLI